jgi:hypothetical protein
LKDELDRQQGDDPKATAPLDTSTPRKLKKPDQTTAKLGGREWV